MNEIIVRFFLKAQAGIMPTRHLSLPGVTMQIVAAKAAIFLQLPGAFESIGFKLQINRRFYGTHTQSGKSRFRGRGISPNQESKCKMLLPEQRFFCS